MQTHRFHGEEIGIARTGAHEIHLGTASRFEQLAPRAIRRVEQAGESHSGRCASSCSSRLALFAAGMRRQNLAPQFADLFEPRAQVLRKLLIDFAAQPLRQRGALTGGRDGNLQIGRARPPSRKRNRNWECRRRCCRGCRAPWPRDRPPHLPRHDRSPRSRVNCHRDRQDRRRRWTHSSLPSLPAR